MSADLFGELGEGNSALDAARRRGAMAAALGRPYTDNPYTKGHWGVGFRRAWNEGYRVARAASTAARSMGR